MKRYISSAIKSINDEDYETRKLIARYSTSPRDLAALATSNWDDENDNVAYYALTNPDISLDTLQYVVDNCPHDNIFYEVALDEIAKREANADPHTWVQYYIINRGYINPRACKVLLYGKSPEFIISVLEDPDTPTGVVKDFKYSDDIKVSEAAARIVNERGISETGERLI